MQARMWGRPELKTLRSGVIPRTEGEDVSHERPRRSVTVTLKHAKTTEAENGAWQRDFIYLKGAKAL